MIKSSYGESPKIKPGRNAAPIECSAPKLIRKFDTTRCVLRKQDDKIQFTQELKRTYCEKRHRIALTALVRSTKRIIFSGEVPFYLSGYTNRQNCKSGGSENS